MAERPAQATSGARPSSPVQQSPQASARWRNINLDRASFDCLARWSLSISDDNVLSGKGGSMDLEQWARDQGLSDQEPLRLKVVNALMGLLTVQSTWAPGHS